MIMPSWTYLASAIFAQGFSRLGRADGRSRHVHGAPGSGSFQSITCSARHLAARQNFDLADKLKRATSEGRINRCPSGQIGWYRLRGVQVNADAGFARPRTPEQRFLRMPPSVSLSERWGGWPAEGRSGGGLIRLLSAFDTVAAATVRRAAKTMTTVFSVRSTPTRLLVRCAYEEPPSPGFAALAGEGQARKTSVVPDDGRINPSATDAELLARPMGTSRRLREKIILPAAST